jgi:hypothetical protein
MSDDTSEVEVFNPGLFEITEELLRAAPANVAALFAHFKIVPVRAEMHYMTRSVEYAAYSPCFEAVPEGQMPLRYNFETITDEDGAVSYRIEREKSY